MFEFLPENFTKDIFQAFLPMKATDCLAYRTSLIFGLGKNRPCFLLHGIVQLQDNMKPPLFAAVIFAHPITARFVFGILQITIPFSLISELCRNLPFYPIRFLTGNPARRCVVCFSWPAPSS